MTVTFRKLLGAALLLVVPLAAWAGAAGAQTFRSGDNVAVSKNQGVEGTLWSSGRTIDIAGTVDGDIFCAGQNVTISGSVEGDIICAAQTIRISGAVSGDVRLAAQTVNISSAVGGNASIAAQSFSLEQEGSIGRDLSAAATEINLNGDVGRDAALGADNAFVTSAIGRNIKAGVDSLRLESTAKVGGDLTYTSDKDVVVARGAQIAGTTHRYEPPQENQRGALSKIGLILNLYMVVALMLIAFAFVLLLPRMFHDVTDVAVAGPLKTFLVGLVAALLFPVLFLALLFTIIGIPLALFLLLVWLVVIAFGWMFFSYYIGRLVLREQRNAIILMLAGALIVLIVSLIPYIGFVMSLAAIWMGIGMVLLRLRGYYARPVYTYELPAPEPSRRPKVS